MEQNSNYVQFVVELAQQMNYQDAFNFYVVLLRPESELEGFALVFFSFAFAELTIENQHQWLLRKDVKFERNDNERVPPGRERYVIRLNEWTWEAMNERNLADEL